MTNAISKWFHKKRTERRGKPPSPILPRQRPRPLTPTPSNEDLFSASAAATEKSSFFQTLPYDIRRKILVEAFGGQVVHMDLFYNHPPLRGGDPGKDNAGHGNLTINRADYFGKNPLKLDESLPKQWLWRSSVCHRNFPRGQLIDGDPRPAQDKCRYGWTEWDTCQYWPGKAPGNCNVGVMGWLLSCRQAYDEGIEVLYSSNAIHSASYEMLMGFSHFLLPQRLGSIRAVELLWEFERRDDKTPVSHPTANMSDFLSFLDSVPGTFPGATSLYISLQGEIHDNIPKDIKEAEWFESNDDDLLAPVDNMVKQLGSHVRDCTIALPSSLYIDRRRRAKKMGHQVEYVYRGEQERHWRSVDASVLGGYWVALGDVDLSFPFVCVMGGFDGLMDDDEWVLYGMKSR